MATAGGLERASTWETGGAVILTHRMTSSMARATRPRKKSMIVYSSFRLSLYFRDSVMSGIPTLVEPIDHIPCLPESLDENFGSIGVGPDVVEVQAV